MAAAPRRPAPAGGAPQGGRPPPPQERARRVLCREPQYAGKAPSAGANPPHTPGWKPASIVWASSLGGWRARGPGGRGGGETGRRRAP